MTKDERIKKELDRLNDLFSGIDANQLSAATSMIQNMAFMRATLEDLQEVINRDGAIEVYQNGEHQRGVKQSAAVQSYNALIKNYAVLFKSLSALLPRERKTEPDDLQRFLLEHQQKRSPEELKEMERESYESAMEFQKVLDAMEAEEG